MAQLPDSEVNNNTNSLIDDIKVNANYNPQHESKQATLDDNDFCDNDSLQNHIDTTDYPADANTHHTIIQNRDPAPEPPSSLTLASLQHFDNENPPQSMLAGTNLIQHNSTNNSSTQPLHNNLSQIMDSFSPNHNNNVPHVLIDPLIEMGFTRDKAMYALQKSAAMMGCMTVEYALQWLFENPAFQVPDTSNISNTIGNMLGNDFLGLKANNDADNRAIMPPNNSPDHHSNGNNNNNALTAAADVAVDGMTDNLHLYDLIDNIATDNKSKSNRIYTHTNTIASAATVADPHRIHDMHGIDEEKNDTQPLHSQTQKMSESKNDFDGDGPIHRHVANTSTVASELSALSTAAVDAQCRSMNHTKDQIQQLYQQQHAMDAYNRNTVSCEMIPNDLKMVIIVRKDLKMSAGKVAAQCCHGCLGVVMDIYNMQYQEHLDGNNNNLGGNGGQLYDLRLILRLWRMNGGKKIVLQCANEKMLLELKDKAMIHNLPHYLVCDAGHTQIKAGSKTVLAIGPYPSVDIDQVTKELKLY